MIGSREELELICAESAENSSLIGMPASSAPLIRSMLDTIRHRGPDDQGIYLSSQVGFGHARLSIIDLNSGHQPLSNEDGTVWIVFNGEIYNYPRTASFSCWRRATFSRRRPTLK